jgi:hypothetical protein
MESSSVQNKARKTKNQSRTEDIPVGAGRKLAVTKVSGKEQKKPLPHFYQTPIFKSKKNDCL